MIYVVEVLNGKFCKVGFTNDEVSVRISQLQTGSPFEIKKVICVEGTLRQEQSLHQSLEVAFARIGIPIPPNEWYPGRNDFFTGFIAALSSGANSGIEFAERYNPNVKQWSPVHGDREINYRWPTK